jgi:hypothetical protein
VKRATGGLRATEMGFGFYPLLEVPVKVPHSVLVSLAKDIGADRDIDYELELGLNH